MSTGDDWGQFATDPFFTAAATYTTCLPRLCGSDERVSNHSCVPCNPGTVNDADDDASGADTACAVVVCAADEYALPHDEAASRGLANGDFCQPCPPGSTNAAGDLADTVCECVRVGGES